MLLAICLICFLLCVRALFGYGRSSRTNVYSMFITFSSVVASSSRRRSSPACPSIGFSDVPPGDERRSAKTSLNGRADRPVATIGVVGNGTFLQLLLFLTS